jgi:myosin-3
LPKVIKRHNSVDVARDCRNTMAKELYGRLFEWLVIRINEQLAGHEADAEAVDKDPAARFIGVLDIFGFESMAENGLEQCFINLANEQLQYFFNQHVFAYEAEEFREEG